ncbi:hypothetical protein BSKO_09349 [Bryopsis sp. KO-2023]|nr:hypothetical protein BSKO_09349 [Bryopsis sp. KO-2023]
MARFLTFGWTPCVGRPASFRRILTKRGNPNGRRCVSSENHDARTINEPNSVSTATSQSESQSDWLRGVETDLERDFLKNELEPGLYVVSTPIGNLGDISLRALRVLRNAAFVFAEDTRRTRILLQAFSIKCNLASCHAHNEKQQCAKAVDKILSGQVVALVSDAGTPCVSDPGVLLIRAVLERRLPVIPIPGASAVMTALVGSGMDVTNFTFVGFLPDKQGPRIKKLKGMAAFDGTMVVYVSPHNLSRVLADCRAVFGDSRPCCLARELTKQHEEFDRRTLGELDGAYKDQPIKGEIVLLIGRSEEDDGKAVFDAEFVGKLLQERIDAGESVSSAVKEIAKDLGVGRTWVYQLAVEISRSGSSS